MVGMPDNMPPTTPSSVTIQRLYRDPTHPLPATRYPFLLVDRVVEWEKEKYAVGYKNVTVNDNFFTGHFPERPIMPGAGGRALTLIETCDLSYPMGSAMPSQLPRTRFASRARIATLAHTLATTRLLFHTSLPPLPSGVLQVEAMAQLAGLVMLDPEDKSAKGLFFFGGIENCRFRKPVVPGDMLVGRRGREGRWGRGGATGPGFRMPV